MIRKVYIFCCILIIFYTVFKRRKADFLSIFIISTVIYYWQLFLGVIEKCDIIDGNRVFIPMKILDQTYIAVLIWLIIGFFWMIVVDFSRLKGNRQRMVFQSNVRSNIALLALYAFESGLILLSIFHNRQLLFDGSFDKVTLLNHSNMIDSWALDFALYLFVFGFSIKGKEHRAAKFFSLLFILYTVMMGHRSFLVLGILGIGIQWLHQQKNIHSLWEFAKEKKKVFLLIIIFIPMIFVLKEILPDLIKGNFEGVYYVLTNNNRKIDMIMHSEPNTITCNLNETLRYQLDIQSYQYVLLSLIPGIGTFSGGLIVPTDFYTDFQRIVYPRITGFGMADTFLGEAYANAGWIGLIIMTNVICICVLLMERYLDKKGNLFLQITFLCVLPFFSFYIHRLTWAYLASTFQNYMYIGILGCILYGTLLHKRQR